MAMDAGLASWVALNQIPGLGNEGLRRLLQTFGDPHHIFATPAHTLEQAVQPAVAAIIAKGWDDIALAPTARWLDDPQNHIVTLADPDYPQVLLNIPDPLFCCM